MKGYVHEGKGWLLFVGPGVLARFLFVASGLQIGTHVIADRTEEDYIIRGQ